MAYNHVRKIRRIQIVIEKEFDLIPYYNRRKKAKIFEFKMLSFRIRFEGIF